MRSILLLAATASLVALGCSGDGTGPRPPGGDGARLAAQFNRLADSVDAGGYSPAAEALRHAAEIVRLTGHATPVTLTVDGDARSFLAVAEQIDYPNLVCSWPADSGTVPPTDTVTVPPPDTVIVPPPDSGGMPPVPPDTTGIPPVDSSGIVPPDGGGGGVPPDTVPIPVDSGIVGPPVEPECHSEGTYSMRTLIAWEPEHLAEVVRIVASLGSNSVATGVPDVMTELPSQTEPGAAPTAPPDSGSGSGGDPGGYPGFMGEYLVRDVGSWFASEGSQTNDLTGSNGACTASRAAFDWAEFDCEAAGFRFQFSMTVDALRYEPTTGVADPPGGPEGSHTLAMGSNAVDGVRLTWEAWTPPPLPPVPGPGPDPIPVDSGGKAD